MTDILVIKLGALGDFVQAFGPFQAIRAAHPGARITLLTTRPYAALAEASPWFDRVWVDERPRGLQLGKWLRLRSRLRSARWAMVYDLQTSDRSGLYCRLLPAGTPSSGIHRGCSHPHANPRRDFLHTVERQAEQLAMAGIAEVPPPDLSWAEADISGFGLPRPFMLMVPGGAPHRPGKRWPASHYAALGNVLAMKGLTPVLLGTDAEAEQIDAVLAGCRSAVSLAGRTSFTDVLALGRKAALAVGNDTGPMHLLATSGCPCLVLFSKDSDPALCAPRGQVTVMQADPLPLLSVDEVMDEIGQAVALPA